MGVDIMMNVHTNNPIIINWTNINAS